MCVRQSVRIVATQPHKRVVRPRDRSRGAARRRLLHPTVEHLLVVRDRELVVRGRQPPIRKQQLVQVVCLAGKAWSRVREDATQDSARRSTANHAHLPPLPCPARTQAPAPQAHIRHIQHTRTWQRKHRYPTSAIERALYAAVCAAHLGRRRRCSQRVVCMHFSSRICTPCITSLQLRLPWQLWLTCLHRSKYPWWLVSKRPPKAAN